MSAVVEVTEEHFVPADRAELAAAGWYIADLVRDIAHHHITDPGRWPCEGPMPAELARLQGVAAELDEAARYVRQTLAPIERRARLRAYRRAAEAATVTDGAAG